MATQYLSDAEVAEFEAWSAEISRSARPGIEAVPALTAEFDRGRRHRPRAAAATPPRILTPAREIGAENIGHRSRPFPSGPSAYEEAALCGDGTFTEGGIVSDLNGYGVIEAESMEEAVKLARGCPVLSGGATVQISEALEM